MLLLFGSSGSSIARTCRRVLPLKSRLCEKNGNKSTRRWTLPVSVFFKIDIRVKEEQMRVRSRSRGSAWARLYL